MKRLAPISIIAFYFSSSVCMSAAENFWIGTFTTQAGKGKGIYKCAIDEASGKLEPVELAIAAKDPAFLAAHPTKPHLYAIGSVANSSYDVANDGSLTLRNVLPVDGKGPYHIAVSQDGNFVAVANYWSGSTSLYRVGPEGNLAGICRTLVHKGRGIDNERQESPHPTGVYFEGDLLMVPDLGIDQILNYRINDGKLKPAESPYFETAAGDGPRHMALHPDGKHVFVVHELSGVLELLSRDGPLFKRVSRIPCLPSDNPKQISPSEVVIHPGGSWVFVSTRGSDKLSIFKFDQNASTLSFASVVELNVKTPRHFTLSPNGRWIIVAGQESNDLNVLSFDPETGKAAKIETTAKVPSPACVLFVPKWQ